MVIEATRKAIDDSADFGCPNVISFTGYAEDVSPEEIARRRTAMSEEDDG